MKLGLSIVLLAGVLGLAACTTKEAKNSSPRVPQSSTSGNGSIGSGGVQDVFKNVIGATIMDLNDDAKMDRAVLVQNDAEADLYIMVSRADSDDFDVFKKDTLVSSGASWGTNASLATNQKNSLLVKSMNDSIGRFRWAQVLTVVLRNGQLLIGGITYEGRDTITGDGGNCDLNLLSGKGTRNGKPVRVDLKPVPLASWNDEMLPQACRFN